MMSLENKNFNCSLYLIVLAELLFNRHMYAAQTIATNADYIY